MATRPRSSSGAPRGARAAPRPGRPARAWRGRGAPPAPTRCRGPGVPRPSTTTTAKPWSANHCDVRWALCAWTTRWPWGPPYGSRRTGSGEPSCRSAAARAVASRRAPRNGQVCTCATAGPRRGDDELDTVERLPLAPRFVERGACARPPCRRRRRRACTPGSSSAPRAPPSTAVQRHDVQHRRRRRAGWRGTAPRPSAVATERTWRSGGVTGSPSTSSRRAPSRSAQVTSARRSSRGTPRTSSTHASSWSRHRSDVPPVTGSTSSTSSSRWSRDCTVDDQAVVAPTAHRRGTGALHGPSRPSTVDAVEMRRRAATTPALVVPAAG